MQNQQETMLQQQNQQFNTLLAAIQTQALHHNIQLRPNNNSAIQESTQEDSIQVHRETNISTPTSQEENTQFETAGSNGSGSPAEADTELQKDPSSEGQL